MSSIKPPGEGTKSSMSPEETLEGRLRRLKSEIPEMESAYLRKSLEEKIKFTTERVESLKKDIAYNKHDMYDTAQFILRLQAEIEVSERQIARTEDRVKKYELQEALKDTKKILERQEGFLKSGEYRWETLEKELESRASALPTMMKELENLPPIPDKYRHKSALILGRNIEARKKRVEKLERLPPPKKTKSKSPTYSAGWEKVIEKGNYRRPHVYRGVKFYLTKEEEETVNDLKERTGRSTNSEGLLDVALKLREKIYIVGPGKSDLSMLMLAVVEDRIKEIEGRPPAGDLAFREGDLSWKRSPYEIVGRTFYLDDSEKKEVDNFRWSVNRLKMTERKEKLKSMISQLGYSDNIPERFIANFLTLKMASLPSSSPEKKAYDRSLKEESLREDIARLKESVTKLERRLAREKAGPRPDEARLNKVLAQLTKKKETLSKKEGVLKSL